MRKASMDVINWLNCIWLTDLPPNSKYLACYLRKFMNSNSDIAWPSYARIIAETGLARATVAKYLKVLEEEGWLERHSGNSTTNTVYIASLPKHINDTVKDFDNKIQEQLRGSSPDELRSSPRELWVVRHANTNKQCNKQSNNQIKDIEQFSIENRVSVENLNGYEYCKAAYRALKRIDSELKADPNGSNIYLGPLTAEQLDDCESKLAEVITDEAEIHAMLTNIYLDRGMGRKKSVSLPYMLMTFADADQFAHIATNFESWIE